MSRPACLTFGNEPNRGKTPTGGVHRITQNLGEGKLLTSFYPSSKAPGGCMTPRILVLGGVEMENHL